VHKLQICFCTSEDLASISQVGALPRHRRSAARTMRVPEEERCHSEEGMKYISESQEQILKVLNAFPYKYLAEMFSLAASCRK